MKFQLVLALFAAAGTRAEDCTNEQATEWFQMISPVAKTCTAMIGVYVKTKMSTGQWPCSATDVQKEGNAAAVDKLNWFNAEDGLNCGTVGSSSFDACTDQDTADVQIKKLVFQADFDFTCHDIAQMTEDVSCAPTDGQKDAYLDAHYTREFTAEALGVETGYEVADDKLGRLH